MSINLSGKEILVIGSNGLLGKRLCHELLNQGAYIYAADIDSQRTNSLKNIKNINTVDLDINNEDAIIDFFMKNKGIDGAVNCAYPRNLGYGRSFFDVKIDDFNDNICMNLGGAFLFSRCCARYFLESSKNFSLVNISSIYGVMTPRFEIYNSTTMTMPVEYAVIKSALIHLNRYIVSFVNSSDFRINSVSPGGIFDNQDKKFVDQYRNFSLGKGLLDPKDICGAIIFLLSDHSQYINGQNIIVDDGFSL